MAPPTNTLTGALYCRDCLQGRGELIYYASCQSHCAICRSQLDPVDLSGAAHKLPTIHEVLAAPSASFWLKLALRGALARDPVDAANDAELLAKLLDERCRQVLRF
jgi:hypothetical protein